jgi:hypothetical protein
LNQAKIITGGASGLPIAPTMMVAFRWTTAVITADQLSFHRNLLMPGGQKLLIEDEVMQNCEEDSTHQKWAVLQFIKCSQK